MNDLIDNILVKEDNTVVLNNTATPIGVNKDNIASLVKERNKGGRPKLPPGVKGNYRSSAHIRAKQKSVAAAEKQQRTVLKDKTSPVRQAAIRDTGVKDSYAGIDILPVMAKVDAVRAWLVTGNIQTAGDLTGIPVKTIQDWKKCAWWNELAKELRIEQQEELDAKMTRLVDKTLEIVEDRLENGDVHVTKSGEQVVVPVKATDAVKALSTVFDKRQLVRNEPTSISKKETTDERLEKLALEFAKFSKAKTIEIDPRMPIEVGIPYSPIEDE